MEQTIQYDSSEFVIGNLRFNATNQCLYLNSETIYLRNKLNKVLLHMIKNRHRTITRNELIDKIWRGNYYTGVKGVTHSVCKLRQSFEMLGADSVKIRTLPKQGYSLLIN